MSHGRMNEQMQVEKDLRKKTMGVDINKNLQELNEINVHNKDKGYKHSIKKSIVFFIPVMNNWCLK